MESFHGSISALIALRVTQSYGMSSQFQFVFSAVVSALTVGGKAITKEIAMKNSTKIVSIVSKLVCIDKK